MKRIFRFPAIVVPVLLLSQSAAAQSTAPPHHLLEIGLADSLYSQILGEERELWIHLPNRGELQPDHRYPVIYLLDGEQHLGGLAMVQEYYNFFRLPEMIVVGISNRTHRTRDLTPSAVESWHGAPVESSGGAETFTRFLAQELIPYVDSRYPTAGHRVLIGHSLGGLFAVNTLLRHRDLFTNYIAIDPSLDWDEQRLLKAAKTELSNRSFAGKGLYLAVSNELIRFSDTLTVDNVMRDTTEFTLGVRSSLELAHAAESNPPNRLNFDWKFYEKDIHGSVPLVAMRDGLVFLYDWWELKHPSLYNDPTTPTETLIRLIRERTATLTSNMGRPMAMEEELLTMLAYMSVEQPDKAQALYGLLIEYYPESAGAQSAMADFLESTGDFEGALRHARKAYDISGSDADRDHVEALTNQLR